MATGRNELCPCGSGKKYKHCHEGKRHVSKGMTALFAVIALIAAASVAAMILGRKPATATGSAPAASNPMNPGAKQPPGPVPPGKVWNEEHGHWHDAPATQPVQVTTSPTTAPQPPGPVPPGKVWSPEHGHWHDAPR